MICPICKDKGQISIKMKTFGLEKAEEHVICCVTCNGNKEISIEEENKLKRFNALWCKCGNPSGNIKYYKDGEHPECAKHCWVCCDCGRLTQIG